MKTINVKPKDVKRKWYLIDAEGKRLGRVAARAASIIRGKNKPEFVPHLEIGDFVIIVNADKAEVTGKKLKQKMYYRHSGYPGGISSRNYEQMIASKPEAPMELAVKGMLPNGSLGRKLFKNLKVYAGENHPHQAQSPEKIEI